MLQEKSSLEKEKLYMAYKGFKKNITKKEHYKKQALFSQWNQRHLYHAVSRNNKLQIHWLCSSVVKKFSNKWFVKSKKHSERSLKWLPLLTLVFNKEALKKQIYISKLSLEMKNARTVIFSDGTIFMLVRRNELGIKWQKKTC